MKATEDHPVKGLWSNLKRGKEEGGFTWSEIADQMSFYVPEVDIKKLSRVPERIVLDKQMTSRYVRALASAWGIPEVILLHGHFETCATSEALKEQTGFDVDAIVKRWHQNREARDRQGPQWTLTYYTDPITKIVSISGTYKDDKDEAAG